MIIKYSVNGEIKTSASSDENLQITTLTEVDKTSVSVKALKPLTLISAEDSFFLTTDKNDLVFLNGYQSWTDTKEFYVKEKEKDVSKIPSFLVKMFAFDRYGDALFYNYGKNKLHGYEIFYKKGKEECFVINNNENAYLICELQKDNNLLNLISDINGISLKEGETFEVFEYFKFNDYKKGWEKFNELYPEKPTEKVFGYTSWYNYYQNINQEIIERDLEALDDRFNLFQIDDGYEEKVGDWLKIDKSKFPEGLKSIVDKIHNKGYKAGIWLAPFVAEEESELFKENKSFFKKDADGNPVKCGANWSGFYALDLSKAEVKDYVKKSLLYYVDMGFDFFKLDFLYGSNLPVYEGKTKKQAAREAYAFLREVLKDKIILGCGATVLDAKGLFDYMRIGPDVSLKFDDVWYMRHFHRERISTKTTLQNTVYRSFMNGRFFGNDPDVFLLRDDNISLKKEQKLALITLNSLFGSVLMTSDNIKDYDNEKKEILNKALDIFYNRKDVSFKRKGEKIEISFTLNEKETSIIYDTEKGVLL